MSIKKVKEEVSKAKAVVDNDVEFLKGYDGVFQDVFDNTLSEFNQIEKSLQTLLNDFSSVIKSDNPDKQRIALTVAKNSIEKILG